ncbi:hypothetical protein H257_14912 [Aphanomyces astaci]|uniref:Uncharacterized protein n=1 Tax=Aphanomyces astaci TaxID=112090 RepID=W4FP84_APHAT|nr:hypothetical protein H257_14912 [Aphanomyces astaci]ETV69285.1 hypothetical protein H257_14912 [Aphanomyces astaci]|eukprot:XP_009841142.1 hypothetical protein H257_14912 [Aphanomyces astaci]
MTNSTANVRAANESVVIADVWNCLWRIITNRLQRASALGDHGPYHPIMNPNCLRAAVAAPAPPPQGTTQADGSVHALKAFIILSYTHRDCLNNPGKSCFYCGVGNHPLPASPTLKSHYARNAMRPGFGRTVFDNHGAVS